MGLLAPWFLAGLLALALPVWLHLLRRRQAPPREFASLMLFEPRQESSVRQRRLRYLLLLALRCLVLAALALAFARPYRQTAAAAAADRLVVLALDDSFSMKQGDRMARARKAALGVLERTAAGERVQVIAFSSTVRELSRPSREREPARAAIAALQAGEGRNCFAELARALRLIAESERGPVQAHVFTDLQKSAMPASFRDLELPSSVRLELHPVVRENLDNWTVEAVDVPSAVYASQGVRVQATVASFSSQPARKRLHVILDGRLVGSREIELPAGGRTTVEFLLPEPSHGAHRGEVRLEPPDGFSEDDRRLFAFERRDPRQALFLHEARDRRSLLYFRTALEASGLGAFRLESATAEEAPGRRLAQYAFVVLSDVGSVPEEFARALRHYVESGGGVLVALGSAVAARGQAGWPAGRVAANADGHESYRTVADMDRAHPCLAEQGLWEGVRFYRVIQTETGAGRVLARLSDGVPLLWEETAGAGRLLVFASAFDNLANDLPLHAVFVPFVERVAAYLGGLDETPGSLTVGASLSAAARGTRGMAAEVIGPGGDRLLSLEEAASGRSFPLGRAGYYEIRRAGGRTLTVAANPDPRESDLSVAPAEMVTWWRGGEGGDGRAEILGIGPARRELWQPLLALALVAALAESLLAGRYLTRLGGTA
ncbi:MAG: BatA domain-containing protein [Bryobacterales bacterium]|nr:BatA domain-containing protein [Bryobacteraceae bacterium]MDW8129769.1 BatA domain-containing protein [Bryobacterales bacterium]